MINQFEDLWTYPHLYILDLTLEGIEYETNFLKLLYDFSLYLVICYPYI